MSLTLTLTSSLHFPYNWKFTRFTDGGHRDWDFVGEWIGWGDDRARKQQVRNVDPVRLLISELGRTLFGRRSVGNRAEGVEVLREGGAVLNGPLGAGSDGLRSNRNFFGSVRSFVGSVWSFVCSSRRFVGSVRNVLELIRDRFRSGWNIRNDRSRHVDNHIAAIANQHCSRVLKQKVIKISKS